ncbi:MAG: LamB/YcsF family protein [Cyanobacteria bacterium SIG27]|nr:LamB/YcsF family protein [Cyanobacteria bacterium SIG27]
MFDFNCDVAQSYGVYKNDVELEIAKYASSINVSAGFHAGDTTSIRNALLFASNNNIAIGAHIGYPDIQGFGKRHIALNNEELEALVIYQVGAVVAYAKTMDLEVEQVRTHGALKEFLNENFEALKVVANAIKKVNPWLNLIVQSPEAKAIVEEQGLKAAYEVDFSENSSIREIRELSVKPDTIHFKTLNDIKRAYDIIKPTPINYNRVQKQI